MLPRWHILFGALFGLFLWLVWPQISFPDAFAAFLASVFIDFDHYLVFVFKTGKISLFEAFKWYKLKAILSKKNRKKGIKMKGDFQIFHTIEFHLFILIFGIFVWSPFLWIFYGMVFHSILDFVHMAYENCLGCREYFLIKWLFDILVKAKNPVSIE